MEWRKAKVGERKLETRVVTWLVYPQDAIAAQ